MKSQHIRLRIKARHENTALAGTAVHGVAKLAGFSGLVAQKIETCVVEAVNNVILHAYEGGPENSVDIHLEFIHSGLLISVVDQGKSMGMLPNKKLEFDPDDTGELPESGMGLFIIQQIMDTVKYESEKDRNILKMFKRL